MNFKNNKQIGEIGERIAIGELSKYGLDIMLPMSDNLPFDFIVYVNNKFYKCQVKTTNSEIKTNSYRFSLTSNNWNKKTEYLYNKDDYDVLICCNLQTIFLFKYSDVENKKNICIREHLAKNNQTKGIHFYNECIISQERLKYIFN